MAQDSWPILISTGRSRDALPSPGRTSPNAPLGDRHFLNRSAMPPGVFVSLPPFWQRVTAKRVSDGPTLCARLCEMNCDPLFYRALNQIASRRATLCSPSPTLAVRLPCVTRPGPRSYLRYVRLDASACQYNWTCRHVALRSPLCFYCPYSANVEARNQFAIQTTIQNCNNEILLI
jgi:hypothetical protein